MFAHAGTSKGRLDLSAEELNISPTIFEALDCADVSSTIYADGWTAAATFWELMKHRISPSVRSTTSTRTALTTIFPAIVFLSLATVQPLSKELFASK